MVRQVFSAPLDLFLGEDGYEHHDVDITVGDRTHDVRVHTWRYEASDALSSAGEAGEAGEDEYRIWGLTAWIAAVVAMTAYQRETRVQLRRPGGGVSLGDFLPT